MKTFFIIWLCFFLGSFLVSQPIEKFFGPFHEGTKAIKLKDYNKAIAEFQKASEIMPNLPHPYYHIACAYSLKQDRENALVWLRRALEKGIGDVDFIQKDPDLQNIRDTEGFKKLMQEFATPKKGINATFFDLDGKKVNLQDFVGKVVILNFWATWCPPCRREIPGFIELYNQYKDQGLVLLGVSNEDVSVLKKFAKDNKINYVMLRSSDEVKLPEPFASIKSIPNTFILDHNGVIVDQHIGFTKKEVFEKQIQKLLAAMPKEPLIKFPKEPLCGGYMEQSVDDPEIQQMAEKATELMKKTKAYSNYKLVKIHKAGTQVVAGTNYYFVLEFATSDKNVVWEIILYRDLSNECSISEKREVPQ